MMLMNKIRYKVMVRDENNRFKCLGSFTDNSKNKVLKLLKEKYKDKEIKIYKETDLEEEDVTNLLLRE